MKPILLALLPAMLNGTPVPPPAHPFTVRASNAADDVIAVVAELPEAERGRWARLLFVFAFRESSFEAGAVGDGGLSLGVLQVRRMWIAKYGSTPAKVLASRREGLRVGLALLRDLERECGSLRAGLGAFVTGKCQDGVPLVARRCRDAGLGSTCGG
jgi:hypothetical protein